MNSGDSGLKTGSIGGACSGWPTAHLRVGGRIGGDIPPPPWPGPRGADAGALSRQRQLRLQLSANTLAGRYHTAAAASRTTCLPILPPDSMLTSAAGAAPGPAAT